LEQKIEFELYSGFDSMDNRIRSLTCEEEAKLDSDGMFSESIQLKELKPGQ